MIVHIRFTAYPDCETATEYSFLSSKRQTAVALIGIPCLISGIGIFISMLINGFKWDGLIPLISGVVILYLNYIVYGRFIENNIQKLRIQNAEYEKRRSEKAWIKESQQINTVDKT